MSRLNKVAEVSILDNFKLDALSTIWQFDATVLDKLENFISERFKYPKGGGWDLDSLREDILFQNDIELFDRSMTLLPDEIAKNRGINLQHAQSTIKLINHELQERYRPNLSSTDDYQTIQEISQVIYAMEAVRLGLLGSHLDSATPPSIINDIL